LRNGALRRTDTENTPEAHHTQKLMKILPFTSAVHEDMGLIQAICALRYQGCLIINVLDHHGQTVRGLPRSALGFPSAGSSSSSSSSVFGGTKSIAGLPEKGNVSVN